MQQSRGVAIMHPLHRQHTATEDGGVAECLSAPIGGSPRDRDTTQPLVCKTLHEYFTVAYKGEKIRSKFRLGCV